MWFPEPTATDDTYANRGESTYDWLSRSTIPRAVACRRFINENLSALPVVKQETFFHNLKHQWQNTFFELIVFRILQELGATVEIEVRNEQNKRPDFIATFSDSTVIVEATVPVINPEVSETLKRRAVLLDLIEAKIPEGWRVGVWELPEIDLSMPRKEFISAINQLFHDLPPPASEIERIKEISTGTIHLHLWPKGTSSRRVVIEPVLTTCDNTEERIRNIITRKKSQARKAAFPVILAIQATGISSDFGDYDHAIYGRTYESRNFSGTVEEFGFLPDGLFTKERPEPPTYAGVLAFLEMSFLVGPPPRLYHHPRYEGSLPSALLELDRSWYDRETKCIVRKPGNSTAYLDRLQFVTR